MTYRGLRLPTINDSSEIKRMLKAFKDSSPYAGFSYDDATVDEHIFNFITGDPEKCLLLVAVNTDNKPVGLISGLTGAFLWNKNENHASELAWWVDPEHRKSSLGIKLKKAFEYWGWKVGCTHIHFALLPGAYEDRLHKYYTDNGFNQTEKSYVKVLRG